MLLDLQLNVCQLREHICFSLLHVLLCESNGKSRFTLVRAHNANGEELN